jgi:hypothetical protein
MCNWHPITWLSHMLDIELFGLNPQGHHFTNVGLHIGATLLLFFLLARITGAFGRSLFVAALFALHPLHVETVAWAAERKDVLSTFFGFLTLLLYSNYAAVRSLNVKSGNLYYLLMFCSFCVGLMAKPMLVTLPVVMILLDYWPLCRFKERGMLPFFALLKEKVPLFFCSILSSFITVYAQRTGGAVVSLETIPFMARFQNSLVSYIKYIFKTVWPNDLAVLYPFLLGIPLWQVALSAFMVLSVSFSVIWSGRRYPYLAVGWFWFLVTLLPVIGLVQVGNQSMADRYMYVPAVGLFIMVAWGIPQLFKVLPGTLLSKDRIRTQILALSATVIIFAAAAVTWRQIGYWQNNFTLYRNALDVTGGNYVINYNLGIAYGRLGKLDEAIQEFRTAISVKPYEFKVRNLLASTLAEKGDVESAIMEFAKTLSLDPQNREAAQSLEYWRTHRVPSHN